MINILFVIRMENGSKIRIANHWKNMISNYKGSTILTKNIL